LFSVKNLNTDNTIKIVDHIEAIIKCDISKYREMSDNPRNPKVRCP